MFDLVRWTAELMTLVAATTDADDPLPSWREADAKRALRTFVARVTRPGPDFVPAEERIAAFDNDGTLWAEHPLCVQATFACDRVHELAPEHPEWAEKQPFAAILADDREALAQLTEHDAAAIVAATHAGLTTEAFADVARRWLHTSSHPRFGRLYEDCAYEPMLELLAFLRANGFTVFVVTGGGVEFTRIVASEVYGIPPHQVVGSSERGRFEVRDGKAVVVKLPDIGGVDDGPGKPVNIGLHVGRRPILAFGNSDGDLAMLEYADGGPRPHLSMLVHHDDAAREYAYDRDTRVGRLVKAAEEAERRHWPVVSMRDDWARVFAEP